MKKSMLLVMVAVMFVGVFAGAACAKTFVSLATGGTGGTYYPVGGGIADIVSKYVPEVQMTSETGNASQANLNLIGTHQIEMALAQNDVSMWAYKGMKPFKQEFKNVRMIASLYPETLHVITMKGSGVKDIMDIKGKRVSVGAPGSGVAADVAAVLRVAGIKYGDMKTDFLDFNNTTQRFKDNQLDVGFVVAGYPTASIMDLATMHDVDLVNFSDEFMNKLIAEYPFFAKSTIPAGTYKGVDHDTNTPAVMAVWICDGDLSEEMIYNVTKAFWENVEELYPIHAKAKMITLDTALDGLSVPLHPGAEKYYKEVGMEIPAIK